MQAHRCGFYLSNDIIGGHGIEARLIDGFLSHSMVLHMLIVSGGYIDSFKGGIRYSDSEILADNLMPVGNVLLNHGGLSEKQPSLVWLEVLVHRGGATHLCNT